MEHARLISPLIYLINLRALFLLLLPTPVRILPLLGVLTCEPPESFFFIRWSLLSKSENLSLYYIRYSERKEDYIRSVDVSYTHKSLGTLKYSLKNEFVYTLLLLHHLKKTQNLTHLVWYVFPFLNVYLLWCSCHFHIFNAKTLSMCEIICVI